ncbi:MAG: ABC transporter permease [Gammaproteobacteria bacterium]|nr:ABC transporter permease [Gammaproteobacteria bacterium]
MTLIQLILKSILNRKFTVSLTVLTIALSVTLLLGVERLRTESRTSFANTLSGTDLVVGARSGAIQLLLYSIFRMGDATNNVSWQSYQTIINDPRVAWAVPLTLGDSHHGFRVMGTTVSYFTHYRYGGDHALRFTSGAPFSQLYDAVLGSDVAATLGYTLGEEIVIAHGSGNMTLFKHDNKPFTVVGILAKTGTPVDQTVHVTLEGIEAIHVDWQSGSRPLPGLEVSAQQAAQRDLTPRSITAILLGVKAKTTTFKLQRFINEYPQEPLLAILPGVALQALWEMIGVAERALIAISLFVVMVGLTSMVAIIITSLGERRREMAILRSVGARPAHIILLIVGESFALALSGALFGVLLLYALLLVAQPLMAAQLGIYIAIGWPTSAEWQLLGAVLGAGLGVGFVPAYRAYRYSLADGMTIRL